LPVYDVLVCVLSVRRSSCCRVSTSRAFASLVLSLMLPAGVLRHPQVHSPQAHPVRAAHTPAASAKPQATLVIAAGPFSCGSFSFRHCHCCLYADLSALPPVPDLPLCLAFPFPGSLPASSEFNPCIAKLILQRSPYPLTPCGALIESSSFPAVVPVCH
jgi:hypothetical protein